MICTECKTEVHEVWDGECRWCFFTKEEAVGTQWTTVRAPMTAEATLADLPNTSDIDNPDHRALMEKIRKMMMEDE